MLEILVGVVVRYDEVAGEARIRLRSPVEKGALLRIVGGHTNKEIKLDVVNHATQELDARVSGVEPGDMVLRVVTPVSALAAA